MKPAYPTNLCPWMHLRRPGIRRRREICSWPRSVQTRPSGTTSWRLAGTCWSRCCSSSCWCCYSSTWEPPRARLQAPLISSGRMASKTLWNSSAGRQEAANQNLISVPESDKDETFNTENLELYETELSIRKLISFVRSFSCQQLKQTVLGKTKGLSENEDTNQNHQTGGESKLSCYLLLYLYFQNCVKVGKWEREERADDCRASLITCLSYSEEDPYSNGRTLNVCACRILFHILLWLRRWWGWQGQNFPDFSGGITSICVVFVVHGNMFTVTGHSPLINIEGFFFPSLFVEIIYFFQACIIIVFELVFFMLSSLLWLSSVKL